MDSSLYNPLLMYRDIFMKEQYTLVHLADTFDIPRYSQVIKEILACEILHFKLCHHSWFCHYSWWGSQQQRSFPLWWLQLLELTMGHQQVSSTHIQFTFPLCHREICSTAIAVHFILSPMNFLGNYSHFCGEFDHCPSLKILISNIDWWLSTENAVKIHTDKF